MESLGCRVGKCFILKETSRSFSEVFCHEIALWASDFRGDGTGPPITRPQIWISEILSSLGFRASLAKSCHCFSTELPGRLGAQKVAEVASSPSSQSIGGDQKQKAPTPTAGSHIFSFTEVKLINRNCTHLKYTTWCFDSHVHSEVITTIKLITYPCHHVVASFFVCVENRRSTLLADFKSTINTVFLIVNTLKWSGRWVWSWWTPAGCHQLELREWPTRRAFPFRPPRNLQGGNR